MSELQLRPPVRRAQHSMPAAIRRALLEQNLIDAYRARPPYQRNDYLGWIAQAKRPETRAKRLGQMLDELRGGKRYMKMPWRPEASRAR
jgi:uncharacterized protein YdeI (YjbR/CyaY-like superfamily)